MGTISSRYANKNTRSPLNSRLARPKRCSVSRFLALPCAHSCVDSYDRTHPFRTDYMADSVDHFLTDRAFDAENEETLHLGFTFRWG